MNKQLSEERFKKFIDIIPKYFNWDIILQNNSIKDISDKGDQFEITCPFHEDKRPSMRLNKNTGVYHCFSCGRKGTYTRFMWELAGKQVPYSVYCENVLKAFPDMQARLGFVSLFIDEKSLDKAFDIRRRFDRNTHLGTELPLVTLYRKVDNLGHTWENLVMSLSLLQAGVSPDGVYAVMNKNKIDINESEKRISLMDLF